MMESRVSRCMSSVCRAIVCFCGVTCCACLKGSLAISDLSSNFAEISISASAGQLQTGGGTFAGHQQHNVVGRLLGSLQKPESYLTCPSGYHWDQRRENCLRRLTKPRVIRCPRGQLNEHICLHAVQPLSRTCPPDYVPHKNSCIRTITASKTLVCPPTSVLDHERSLCVSYLHQEVGYVCEKGVLTTEPIEPMSARAWSWSGLEQGNGQEEAVSSPKCVETQVVNKDASCPDGFARAENTCQKITYFPCALGETTAGDKEKGVTQADRLDTSFLSPFYSARWGGVLPDDLGIAEPPSQATSSTDNTTTISAAPQRKLGGAPKTKKPTVNETKSAFDPGETGKRELCWSKQIISPTLNCPANTVLQDGSCTVHRFFPLISKCSGVVKNGKCVITKLQKPVWSCPLNNPSKIPAHGIPQRTDYMPLHPIDMPSSSFARGPTQDPVFFSGLDFYVTDSPSQGLYALHPTEQLHPTDKRLKKVTKAKFWSPVRLLGAAASAVEPNVHYEEHRIHSQSEPVAVSREATAAALAHTGVTISPPLYHDTAGQIDLQIQRHSGHYPGYRYYHSATDTNISDKKPRFKVKVKKKKQSKKEELKAKKSSKNSREIAGYCYRSKYADYALDCPEGYRPHLHTSTCRKKFKPAHVCDHGFVDTQQGCVKYEYVAPIPISATQVKPHKQVK